MKIAVRYYSRSGNTKRLADAIGKALGVPVKTVDKALNESVDILFLGGAIYAGKIDKHLENFINTLTVDKVKRAAVFSSSIGKNSAYNQIKGILEKSGIDVEKNFFHCKGQFMFFGKGKPNEQDCMNAENFAKQVVKK